MQYRWGAGSDGSLRWNVPRTTALDLVEEERSASNSLSEVDDFDLKLKPFRRKNGGSRGGLLAEEAFLSLAVAGKGPQF